MEMKELAKKAIHQSTNGNGKTEQTISKIARDLQGQVSKAASEVASQATKLAGKLSNEPYLLAGLGCLGISVLLRATGVSFLGRLMGQAAAPLLVMALYNRVVKLEGSEGAL
jgi:hypothetical protein